MPVEDNNQLVHARSMPVADGVVLSLTTLPDLTPTQEESFRRIGLHRVSDLLHLRAVHDAQLISALGRVVHDVENHAAAGRVGRRHRTGRAPCQPHRRSRSDRRRRRA